MTVVGLLCWYPSILVKWMHLSWRYPIFALLWPHIEHDGISDHRRLDCLFNRLFRRKSQKTSKLRAIGLCEGNSPVTGEFRAQRASDGENVSIWWRHYEMSCNDLAKWYVRNLVVPIMAAGKGDMPHYEHPFCIQTWYSNKPYLTVPLKLAIASPNWV